MKIATGVPRANWQAERANRDIHMIPNNTVNGSIGNTPAKLLFWVDHLRKIDDKLTSYFHSLKGNN